MQSQIDRLNERIELPGMERVGGFDLPQQVNPYTGLPESAPGSRMTADEITQMLMGGNVGGQRFDRSRLGGPAGNNEWEQMALADARGGAGRDPGQQFGFQEVPSEVYSQSQIQQLANRSAAPTIRAFQDAEMQMRQAAGAGGYADPNRLAALRTRAAIEGAGAQSGAMRDATLQAAQMNAQQALAAAGSRRSDFGADISARLGLGQLGLGRMQATGALGMERRGLDQERDVERFRGGITERGQDIEQGLRSAGLSADMLQAALSGQIDLRGQDIGYATERGRQGLEGRGQDISQRGQDISAGLEMRGQDVTQRAQDLEQQYRSAGMNAEQARAAASAALGLRGQNVDVSMERGRQNLAARGQTLDYQLGSRRADIEQALGLGQLGLAGGQQALDLYQSQTADLTRRYGIDVGTEQLGMEIQARMAALDRELGDRGLDRETRSQLERERQQLERDIQANALAQQQRQFEGTLGFQREQLGFQREGLGEQRREFDLGQVFSREQLAANQSEGRLGRNLQRELGGFNQPGVPGPYGGAGVNEAAQRFNQQTLLRTQAIQAQEAGDSYMLRQIMEQLRGLNARQEPYTPRWQW